MIQKTILVFCVSFLLGSLFQVSADPASSPVKLRLNKDVITMITHLLDHDVFKKLTDVEIANSENTMLEHFEKIMFSLQPSGGIALDDFNFDIQIEKEYLGVESTKIEVKGVAKLKDGKDVPFTAPVNLLKLQYELVSSMVDINDVQIPWLNYTQKEWTVQTGQVSGDGLSKEASNELSLAILKNIDDYKEKLSNIEIGKDFPVRSAMPMMAIGKLVQNFAELFDVDEDKFITVGYNANKFMKTPPKRYKLLKPIESVFFNSQNSGGNDALIQVSIDENFFGIFTIYAVDHIIQPSFGIRDILKSEKRWLPALGPLIPLMTTKTIGTVIPTFKEEYPSTKNLDVVLWYEHVLFKDGFPNAKRTGISFDKNGNLKYQLNLYVELIVEKTPNSNEWEIARDVYITTTFKAKLASKGKNPQSKKLTLTPKNIEVSDLKVLKNGEEQEMEQMMIQSFLNIQLENVNSKFKEFSFPQKALLQAIPKEVECLGFKITDLDIAFKKSQMQFSVYHEETKQLSGESCEQFLDKIGGSQTELVNKFQAMNETIQAGIKHASKLARGADQKHDEL